MNNKTDIIAKFINTAYGVDYTDRYMCPAEIYNYIFEENKQSYVWQSKQRYEMDLTEGSIYHLKARVGNRLLGGRGLSINEVEIIGQMNIDNKIIRLTQ
ncbi:hypothetical protein [Paenibacillus sp. FSL H3-0286]|uniref:hypothetical protein n=1 Tax=Paenibacillus sp. FSL H3-0286 TaxID=2921427 RepID=UPI00325318AD